MPAGRSCGRHLWKADYVAMGCEPGRWRWAASCAGVRDSVPNSSGIHFDKKNGTPGWRALQNLHRKLLGLENGDRLLEAPALDQRNEFDSVELFGGDSLSCFGVRS